MCGYQEWGVGIMSVGTYAGGGVCNGEKPESA